MEKVTELTSPEDGMPEGHSGAEPADVEPLRPMIIKT